MFKTSLSIFSITSKSSSDVINEDEVNGKHSDKIKNSPIFSISQKPTGVDYFIHGAKKTFNFLQNMFISTYQSSIILTQNILCNQN